LPRSAPPPPLVPPPPLHDALPICRLCPESASSRRPCRARVSSSTSASETPTYTPRERQHGWCPNVGSNVARVAAPASSRSSAERSEEHTSESSHQIISYAVFCLKK